MRTGARWLLILAAVGLQNLLYFSLHYTQGWMIPWDFIGPYYALPQYWIEAAHAGVSSNWIPFQGMGYPIHLNVQSGFHYLPLQWFAWVGWPYTLTSAVVLQGLHVAFGALGAAWCAHLLRMDWKLALLAALAYQGFGGFYGNASHPDIVRAYALLPWLMGPVVAPWTDSTRLRVAVALVPLWTQMMWTGGYSGNAIATLALLGGVTAARTAFNVRQQPARWLGLALLAALGTGTLLAAPALLPAFMEKAEMARSYAVGNLIYDYLQWNDVWALTLRTEGDFFGHDLTMRSLYLGLPVLALLALRCLRSGWAQARVPAVVFLLALGMASGVLHAWLIHWVAPLGYSRFVLADYRGLMALSLLLLALQALQPVTEGQPRTERWWQQLWWVPVAGLVIGAQWMQWPGSTPSLPVILQWQLVGFSLVACILLVRFAAASSTTIGPAVLALCLLLPLDWLRVHWNAPYFQTPDVQKWMAQRIGSETDLRSRLHKALTQPPPSRPARVNVTAAEVDRVPWQGYLSGAYMVEDSAGPMHLNRQQRIVRDPWLQAFAQRPWTALWLPDGNSITAEAMTSAPQAPLRSVRYGTDRIEYEVDLPRAGRVVENEVHSGGWTGLIAGQKISPFDAHDFRAWNLPAGKYRFVAVFEPPHHRRAQRVAGLGILVWLAMLVFVVRMRTHE
jgi:hypothetical protein